VDIMAGLKSRGPIHAPKPDVDFRPGKVTPPTRPRTRSRPDDGGWLGAGLFRILVFGAIAVGGVAVVLWLRDLGSAAGVNWLH
jgi:hypothetical protein